MKLSPVEIGGALGGVAASTVMFMKYIMPTINNFIKSKTEVAKMKIKADSLSNDAVIELLKERIDKLELKEDELLKKVSFLEKQSATLTEQCKTLKSNYEELKERYINIKGRYTEKTAPKSRKKKKDESGKKD